MPEVRLIDANALKDRLPTFAGVIDEQPTIEAESVRHGQWVDAHIKDVRTMADLIDRDAVIWITAETGALETQRRVKELPAINRWISVEDALPDAFIYVICAGEEGMAILRYNGEVWVDDAGCIYPMSAITHWRHLPEPPKEDET